MEIFSSLFLKLDDCTCLENNGHEGEITKLQIVSHFLICTMEIIHSHAIFLFHFILTAN